MECLHKQREVQLCYTPVYMMDGLKCSFLNTRNIHKYFISVETDHNICAADIMFLAETTLMSSDDNDNYQIQASQVVCQNDQIWNKESRPPHGIICYAKNSIKILEVQKKSCELFEAIFVCVQHTSLPIPCNMWPFMCHQNVNFNN